MADADMTGSGPLARYRVLDLTDMKGDLCTLLLAELGADVIRIEPPDGHATRWIPPFAGDIPDRERSLYFLYRNSNKRGITLNIESDEGRDLLRRLVPSADVLVESYEPGHMDSIGLGYESLKMLNPGLVMASITEFGQDGPRAHYRGAPVVALAMSGAMQVAGFPDKPPCNAPNAMAYDMAAVYAGTGIMLAIYGRGEGDGRWLDISVQEASICGLYPWAVPTTSYGQVPGGLDHPVRGGAGIPTYRCRDGYVRVSAGVPRHWEAIKQLLGNPDSLEEEAWSDSVYRRDNADTLRALIEGLIQDRPMQELFINGQALGLPITPLQPPSRFAEDPHPHARGYFHQVEHPVAGTGSYPGAPMRMSATPLSFRKTAPLVGEDNDAIYRGEMGLSVDEIASLKVKGVV